MSAKKPQKKVAIVGFSGTRDMAPYNDETWEIWSVNNLYKFIPRTDRIFEMHDREDLEQRESHGQAGESHIEFLKQCPIPVYMQKKHEDIPNSIAYPIDEMVERFGIPRLKGNQKDAYFTNSISYMIALAIIEKFDVMHIYGVDMAVGTEYSEQRPSCEYYIGIAKGLGMEIKIPVESDLLKTRFMYGYEAPKERAWQMKCEKTVEEMMKRKQQADMAMQENRSVSDKYEGAIQAVRELTRTWG